MGGSTIVDNWPGDGSVVQVKKEYAYKVVTENILRMWMELKAVSDLPPVVRMIAWKRSAEAKVPISKKRVHHRSGKNILPTVVQMPKYTSLADVMRQGPLPAATLMTLYRDISKALQQLHAQGYAHGDIQPCNILVDAENGRFLLNVPSTMCKINAALKSDELPRSSQWYAAPEKLVAGSKTTATSMDVWSFGVVMLNCTAHCRLWNSAHNSDPQFSEYVKAYMSLQAEQHLRQHVVAQGREWLWYMPAVTMALALANPKCRVTAAYLAQISAE